MITCPNCEKTELVRMNRFGYEHIDQNHLTGRLECPDREFCGYSEER